MANHLTPIIEPISTIKPPRWKRWLKKLLKIGLAVYIGLAVIMFFLQDWMIFPGASSQGKPEANVRMMMPDQQLLRLPTRTGQTIAVMFGPALLPNGSPHPTAASRPTILYFYGNAMCISACSDEFAIFRRLGVNVAIAEFIGYGLSTGKPSEAGVYETADTAYQYLLTRSDIDPKQIISAGWSLGATAAIHLASNRSVGGLATFSAFTRMKDMAHQILPWFPTSLLVKYRFDNERAMALVKCPAFLAHGTIDGLVPYSMNARLIKAATCPVTVVPVEGSDHTDIFEVGGADLWQKLSGFIERLHANAASIDSAEKTNAKPPR